MTIKIKNVRDAWKQDEIDMENYRKAVEQLMFLTYLMSRKEDNSDGYTCKNQGN